MSKRTTATVSTQQQACRASGGPTELRPGDVLGLSGACALGDAINLATWGVPRSGLSHLAIVTPYCPSVMQAPGLVVCEATTRQDYPCAYAEKCVSGVQAHWPAEWLHHQKGRVWLYRPSRAISEQDAYAMGEWCSRMMGVPYDYWGALHARQVVGGWLLHRFLPEDFNEFFCSEFVPAALRWVGLFEADNCSVWSPNKFTRHWLRTGGCERPVRIK